MPQGAPGFVGGSMKSRMWTAGRWALLAALWMGGGSARAAEPAESLGLNLDLGVASAYNWRGVNAFGDRQGDQNAFISPGITWTVAPGLTLGYWGAYQVVGDNASAKIDGGVGAENDLVLAYATDVAPAVTATFGLVAYVFPLADEQAAGVASPTYLEPSAAIAWAGPVDLGLKASYFAGVQDELEAYRYLYLVPTVGKSFSLSSTVGLGLSLAMGYKAFAGDYEAASNGNLVDLALTVSVPVDLTDRLYLKPAINAAWTDLDKDPDGGPAGFSDEAFVFGSLNVGVNL
jgi:hypothetical protein